MKNQVGKLGSFCVSLKMVSSPRSLQSRASVTSLWAEDLPRQLSTTVILWCSVACLYDNVYSSLFFKMKALL